MKIYNYWEIEDVSYSKVKTKIVILSLSDDDSWSSPNRKLPIPREMIILEKFWTPSGKLILKCENNWSGWELDTINFFLYDGFTCTTPEEMKKYLQENPTQAKHYSNLPEEYFEGLPDTFREFDMF